MISNQSGARTQAGSAYIPMLEKVLREVAHQVPNLRWAIVASLDGVIQSTYNPFGRDRPDRILAMVSSILTLAQRVFYKLQHGQLSYLTLAGDVGMLVAYPVGETYLVAINAPIETEINVIQNALARAATTLKPALYPRPL